MDKLHKFLKRLLKKERQILINKILPKIRKLDLNGLDVKKLSGTTKFYRVRFGKVRIIFEKKEIGIIRYIGGRGDIYKKFR